MSSVQNLRELINERLTAAAEEIFTEFEKTIVQYEEEIDRQRRLLDNMWKAEIKFHTTDLLQQPVREENVFAEQNLCNQERNSSLKQKDPEPPQMKEEQEELCTTQEGEQLVLMQAADVLAEGKSKCEEISRKIFEVSDKPLDQLDEEIDYQYRALSITLKPRITLHRVDHPQQHVCKENFIVDQEDPNPSQIKEEQEEFHTSIDQKEPETPKIIKEQEEFRTSLDEQYPESPRFKEEQEEFHTSLDQEDSEPPQINEEQEKLFTSQQGKQNVLKQVTDTFLLTSTEKDGDFSELETNSEQLLSSNSLVAESPHEEGSKHVDSGSTRNAALKAKKSRNRKSSHSNNADKTSLSESHCDTDTGRKSLKCDVFGNTFKNEYQIHKGIKPYACSACGKSFSLRSQLKVHMRSHTGEKPYFCKICGKSFSTSSSVTIHVRSHTGEKPFSCERCGKTFILSNHLTVHMRTHTGEKPYPCERCGKSFSERGKLTVHMRTHTGEKPYTCERCGKSFSERGKLTVHMRKHTGEKPYFCERCGKTFIQNKDLLSHIRTHTIEKPHSCKTCGKSFSQGSHLISHVRTHTGEKPFSCETCGKNFSERSNLTVHMRTHTGEKPFSCERCGKTFSQSTHLTRHMKTHK